MLTVSWFHDLLNLFLGLLALRFLQIAASNTEVGSALSFVIH